MATPSPTESARQRYVMLVDDDAALAEMYRLGLEHNGFRVRAVADGPSLFRAIAFEVPDLVILDWSLPGLNGGEILERIRQDGRTRSLPVVMLSNYPPTQEGAIDRVFSAGAVAWLQKAHTSPADLSKKLDEAFHSLVS